MVEKPCELMFLVDASVPVHPVGNHRGEQRHAASRVRRRRRFFFSAAITLGARGLSRVGGIARKHPTHGPATAIELSNF